MFTLSNPRTHLCVGFPPIDQLTRGKHVELESMEVRELPFLKYYGRVPNMAAVEMFPEVGAVNLPPLTPLHVSVNFSRHPWEKNTW